MTRGCGILVAAAFTATATWPSPAPSRSSSLAWGFFTTTLPSTAFSPGTASRRALHSRRRGSWSAAPSAPAAGERRESICDSGPRALHMIAAVGDEGSEVGAGSRRRALRPLFHPCRQSCNGNGRRTFALAGTTDYGGGDGGDGGLGRVGLDPESVAKAREAAKNDDYDWFMEFIEGGEDDDGGGGIGIGLEGSSRGAATGVQRNTDGGAAADLNSGGGGRQRSGQKGGRRQGQSTDTGFYGSSSRYDSDLIDGNAAGVDVPAQRRPPPTGRGFQPPATGSGGDGRRRGQRPSAAADSAYDYDLDDEYDREPGRGGWDYDPGLSAGIGQRRRDVQVDKVRAKTKPASMRLPLEDDQDVATTMGEGGGAQAGGAAAAASAAAVNFEPVDSEKAKMLVEGLGYTEPEVACMDPDMADLAIERAIRRPTSGMPPDWVAVGMPPPPTPPASAPATPAASSPSSVSSQTYFGERAAGAPGAGAFGSDGAAAARGVDGGALDLDAILGDGFDDDYEEIGDGRSRRQGGTRRDRPGYPSGDRTGDREQTRGGTQEGGEGRRRDSAYPPDGGGRQQRREGGRGAGGYGYDDYDDDRGADSYFYEDEGAPRNGRRRVARGYAGEDGGDPRGGGRRGERRTDVGGGRRRRRKEEKEPEMSPAERYEREIFGGLGGGAAAGGGGGGGGDGWGRDDEDDAKLWTGVGPDGPWPTMEEFTKLLREETEVRLGLVGPWAAEVVSVENRFRLQAYEKWLEVLDKGIGATLEEAGVFDAAFSTDDDDYDDDYDAEGRRKGGRGFSSGTNNNNLYDNYTNYGYRPGGDGGGRRADGRGGGDGYGYDPQGRQDERGFDYDDRYGGEDGSYRQRPRRPKAPGRQKFDVGSFLRSGAQSIMQPGVGMEDKAAEFERRYPGRTRSNAMGYGEDDDAYAGGSNDRNSSDDEFDRRRGQRARRDGESRDEDPRGGRRGRGEDRGSWSRAGYQDEDDYEY